MTRKLLLLTLLASAIALLVTPVVAGDAAPTLTISPWRAGGPRL